MNLLDLPQQTILQVLIFALHLLIVTSDTALDSMNSARLSQLAAGGDKKAARLLPFINGTQSALPLTIADKALMILSSALAAVTYGETLAGRFADAGLSNGIAHLFGIFIVTFAVCFLYFISGDVMVKQLANRHPDETAMKLAVFLKIVCGFFLPFVVLLTGFGHGILRLFGIKPTEQKEVSEEKIRLLVDQGSESGAIDSEEKEIIQNVFEFDDMTVGEFATHRTEISILWAEESLEEWEAIINESKHTHYPVCGETVDNVLGVLDSRDFFRLRASCTDVQEMMEKALTPAYFVPETVKADVLFKQMKSSHNYFAVVLDEYGGMLGIATINDLIEQIVGEMETAEDALDADEIEKIDDDKWRVIGTARLDDLAEEMDIPLPVDEYDTFGGYVFGIHGSVPDDGSQLTLDTERLHIEVTSIHEHKLECAVVTRLPEPEDE